MRNAGQEPSRSPARRLHRDGRAAAGLADLVAHVGAGVRGAAAQRRAAERRRRRRSASDATREGARAAGLADGIVGRRAGARAAGTIRFRRLTPRGSFPQYLAAVEQLARAVDAGARNAMRITTTVTTISRRTRSTAARISRRFATFVSFVVSLCSRSCVLAASAVAQEPPRADAAGQRLRRRDRSGERGGDGRADPLAAAGERRRGGRRHGRHVQAVRRHPRVRGEDVREPRPRHRPARQGQRAARRCSPSTIGRSGSKSATTSRVHHRRVCRRDQPPVHGAGVPAAATTAPACWPGVSRIIDRIAERRNVTLQGVRRGSGRARTRHRIGRNLLLALFVLFIVINALAGRHAPAAAIPRRMGRAGRIWTAASGRSAAASAAVAAAAADSAAASAGLAAAAAAAAAEGRPGKEHKCTRFKSRRHNVAEW